MLGKSLKWKCLFYDFSVFVILNGVTTIIDKIGNAGENFGSKDTELKHLFCSEIDLVQCVWFGDKLCIRVQFFMYLYFY